MNDFDPPDITPDIREAANFLATFGVNHSFQVLPESGAKGAPILQHGSIEKLSSWLISKNRSGYGIFFMVNAGNGSGRKAENVISVRAFFVDLDGAPYEEILIAKLEPSIITESSPGRYHAYWLVADAPLKTFSSIQKQLAAKFNSDPSINDLPRIMRVPGFYHLKKTPFKSTVRQSNNVRYDYQRFVEAFKIDPYATLPNPANNPAKTASHNPANIAEGSRHTRMLSISGSLRNQGLTGQALTDALMQINKDNCSPPLPYSEIAKISASISKKPQNTFENRARPIQEAPYKPPQIISFSALQRTKYKPIQWIVRNLLPEGLTIVAGKAKLGKSWLAQSISLAVAAGAPALGYFESNTGAVLSLSLEDTPRRYQHRMNLLLKNSDPPENAFLSVEWPRLPKGLDDLKRWLDAQRNPRLIVLDTLAKLKPTSMGYRSGTLYDRDYSDIEQLQRLAAEYQIGILAITHKNKSETEDDYDSVTGSAAMTGVADSIWIFNRKSRGTPQSKLNISGRDIADITYTLSWDSTAASWYYLPEENPESSTAKDRIISLLKRENRPLSASDVAEMIGISRGYASKMLSELVGKRLVEKSEADGGYLLGNNHSTIIT